MVAIVCLFTLILAPPVVSRALDVTAGQLFAGFVVLGAVIVVSGVIGIFGGGFARGRIATEAEEALEAVVREHPSGDADALRRAAVRLIVLGFTSYGPSTVATYDAAEYAERLGPALDHVKAVERILVEEGGQWAVFTEAAPGND